MLCLIGCEQAPPPQPPGISGKPVTPAPQLTLNNAILEQANAQGQPLWKIQAERSFYTQNSQTAHLEKLRGNLFENGQIALEVSALSGEIEQNGEVIFLKGDIVARDKRNGAVFQAKELKWYPKEGVLKVKKNVQGSHPQLEISASEGKYYSRQQRLELIGNIVATSTKENIQIKTEHLFWELPQQKLKGDQPLEIVRYQKDIVTDRVLAGGLLIDLNKNTAQVEENVQLKSLEPPVRITASKAIWNYENRTLTIPTPVEITHTQEKVTINANQGEVDLKQQVAELQGGVKGKSLTKVAEIYSDKLVWQINQQTLKATGNVIYQQQDPPMQLKGPQAVGKLQDNTIVVSGNEGTKVVTEIIP